MIIIHFIVFLSYRIVLYLALKVLKNDLLEGVFFVVNVCFAKGRAFASLLLPFLLEVLKQGWIYPDWVLLNNLNHFQILNTMNLEKEFWL